MTANRDQGCASGPLKQSISNTTIGITATVISAYAPNEDANSYSFT